MIPSQEPPATEQEVQEDHGKLADIQILRGVSIISVLLCHLSITPAVLNMSPSKFTMPFYLGVEIFFVISGFVITNSLLRDRFNGPRFFIKRVFRLIPTLVVCICISYAVNQYFQRSSPSEHAKDIFSIRESRFWRQSFGVLGGYFILVDGPTAHCYSAMWSLSIEDQFYALLAATCLLGGVPGFRRNGAVARLVFVGALGIYLSLSGLRIARIAGFTIDQRFINYLLQWRFEFLALGICLAFANVKIKDAIVRKFKDSGIFVAPLLLCGAYGLAALCDRDHPDAPPPFSNDPLLLACGALFGLLVMLAANGLALPKTRGLAHRIMHYFGDRSYSLYVMHYLVFAFAWLMMNAWIPSAFSSPLKYGLCQLALTLSILLPLVELIYRFVELPGARLGRRIAGALANGAGPRLMELKGESPERAADVSRPIPQPAAKKAA